MESLEEEKELEIFWYLLQGEAHRENGDEPGDVEQEGENDHREHMSEDAEPSTSIGGSFLRNNIKKIALSATGALAHGTDIEGNVHRPPEE